MYSAVKSKAIILQYSCMEGRLLKNYVQLTLFLMVQAERVTNECIMHIYFTDIDAGVK